jgi:hypothetical protein
VNVRLWVDGLRRILHPSRICSDDIRRRRCRGISDIASVTRVSDRRRNGGYTDLPVSRNNSAVLPRRDRLRRSFSLRSCVHQHGRFLRVTNAHHYPGPDRLKIQVITLRGFPEANRGPLNLRPSWAASRAVCAKSKQVDESDHGRTRAQADEQTTTTTITATTPEPQEPALTVVGPIPTPTQPHDKLLAQIEAALAEDAAFQAKVEALPSWRATITSTQPVADDDDGVGEILQAIVDKPLPGDRPRASQAANPVEHMSAESIVPENYSPSMVPAEEDLDAARRSSGRPEDDERRRLAALAKRAPWLATR